MTAITPEFVFDLETNMRRITTNEYERLVTDMWWNKVARRTDSLTKKERINWLLDTARLERREAGSMTFEDVVAITTEFENEFAAAGLEITKEKLEDLFNGIAGGEGMDIAAHWSRQMGILAAYFPQKMVATAIRKGGDATSLTYDGQKFFDTDHPVNGVDADDGTFANDLTGAALGGAAAKIDTSVTLDAALDNLQRVFAYMAGIPMANGQEPRKLRPVGIMVPPALMARAQQLTNARLLAQAAASGGGGADVEAVIRNWGIGQPIQADELGANFGGSDTTYYIIAAGIDRNELGALLYLDREPFNIVYHNEITSAELARTRMLQWTTAGRNTVGYGHPYLLFRVPAV
jgi:phage major head subunit gpT-like protein